MTRARDVANLIGSGNYSSTTFTATAGQTAFSISHTQGFVQVFMNGLLLDLTVDYTSNGSAITLTSGAAAGDEIEVVKYNTFSVGDAIPASGGTFTGAVTHSGNLDVQGAITSDGLTVDTSDQVIINHSGDAGGLRIDSTNNTNTGSIRFGDVADNYIGAVEYNHSTDALSFYANNATRMTIDSSGRVTKPSQPSFKAMGSSNQYIHASPIEFPTVSGYGCHNIGSHYDTSNYKFTAPIAGRYFFHVHVGIIRINASTAACYPQLRINGASSQYSYIKTTGTAPDYVTAHLSAVLNLAASDYVDVTFVGGSNSQYYNGPTELTFQGHLIG